MGVLILWTVWLISLANRQPFNWIPAGLDNNVEVIWAVQNICTGSMKLLGPGVF